MAGTISDILVTLGLDTTNFDNSLAKTEGKLTSSTKKMEKGFSSAGAAANSFGNKIKQLDKSLYSNIKFADKLSHTLGNLGNKMTMFVTIPIIGFFASIIKKAMEADTAIGKLAKESVEKLNASLLKLGEKFLPVFIKFVEWVTKLLDKFLALPPETQEFITKLILVAALAGPLLKFSSVLVDIASGIVSIGEGAALASPGVATLGTTIWGALLPLLPIIALIAAAILLVYLLWKNWDELGVIIKQLAAIVKWEFATIFDYLTRPLRDFIGGFKAALENGAGMAESFLSGIANVFLGLGGIFQKPGEAIFAFMDGIRIAIENGAGYIEAYLHGIASAFFQLGGGFEKVGQFIMGIVNVISGVRMAVTQFVKDFVDGFSAIEGQGGLFEQFLTGLGNAFLGLGGKGNEFFQKIGEGIFALLEKWNTAMTNIQNFFTNAFTNISNFFNSVRDSIIAGINAIITAVQNLISWLGSIVMPEALTPGSPTPFEKGIRGISEAMREMTKITPSIGGGKMAGAGAGAVNNITINVGEIKNRNDMDYLAQEILRRITSR